MRVIAKLQESRHGTPVLWLSIHGAPHRRVQVEVLHTYRDVLRMALMRAGIQFPIRHPIELEVLFVDPSSPDLGNLYLALEQAMDGATLLGPGIVEDDSLIQKMTASKFYPSSLERTDEERANGKMVVLPKYTVMARDECVS